MKEPLEKMIKKCVIITGMSGGGKSSALKALEDNGFYAIDNLPPTLLPNLLDNLTGHQQALKNGVAVVIDGRSGSLLRELDGIVEKLRSRTKELTLIFLDAADETLVRRFETTRRSHPLASGTTILGSIRSERDLIASVRESADIIVDTTDMTLSELKKRLLSIVEVSVEEASVIFSSFGFKYGLPQDADYVFDVRFMPNPNYVEELHALAGTDVEIQEYLHEYEYLGEFMTKTKELLEFIFQVYGATGKKQFHAAIGCTGGRHRSVAVAELLARHFMSLGKNVFIVHRDIDKGNAQ